MKSQIIALSAAVYYPTAAFYLPSNRQLHLHDRHQQNGHHLQQQQQTIWPSTTGVFTTSSSAVEDPPMSSPVGRKRSFRQIRLGRLLFGGKCKSTNDDDDDDDDRGQAYYMSNIAMNDNRYSTNDWWHNMVTLPQSTILHETWQPVSTLFGWGVLVSVMYNVMKILSSNRPWAAMVVNNMCLAGPVVHSFMVSPLGLLLVFRTNTAYERFQEARRTWEKVHSVLRDLSRMVCLYQEEVTTTRKLRICRLLAAFPYLLRHHVRPKDGDNDDNNDDDNDNDDNSGDDTQLPWCLLSDDKHVRNHCLSASNPPMWAADRLSSELADIPYGPNFTSRERLAMLKHVDQLSGAIGACERIHQTAIPYNYARHALRSLGIWLSTLPFAIVKEIGWLTGPVVGIIAWLLFGVFQIGASIEDPFQGSLRLESLCDAMYKDVMYNGNLYKIDPRESAFELVQPFETKEWENVCPLAKKNGVSWNAGTPKLVADVQNKKRFILKEPEIALEKTEK